MDESHEDVPPVSAEHLVDGAAEQDATEPRRYPSTLGGLCYLGVLLAALIGLVLTVLVDWRVGVRVVGASLVAAAVLRLLLWERQAGMLAVRNRFLDATMLTVTGGLLVFLATTIPNQPGA